MLYVGLDVGGTSLKAGLVDETGRILAKRTAPTGVERGAEAVVNDMAQLAIDVMADGGASLDEVASIGIGLPGILDPKTGRVPFCTNLYWHDVPVVELMHRVIDKPVYIENDATVAGLAESVAGVSAGVKNSVFVTLGTGVGGGIIIDGKVYSGSNGVGSEVGHMITVAGGEQCTCGNRGCWERYASATALIRMAKTALGNNTESLIYKSVNGKINDITAKTVIDAAKAGDKLALKIFDEYTYHLCVGLINIINCLDPEVIVLGGGVSHAGDILLEAINKKLPELVFYKTMPRARVVLASLGNDAGIIGAAMLGRQ